jgi:hypothetical protein
MQAAVDAAHDSQGVADAAASAEPATEPMPRLRAAVAAQDWPTVSSPNGVGERGDAWTFRLGANPGERGTPADALDDLAESYLAADPDLSAGYAEDAEIDGPALQGWDALRHDAAPGTDVRHSRAPWWDHAVQSGRTGRAVKPQRQKIPAERRVPDVADQPSPRRRRIPAAVGVVALAVVVVAGGVVALELTSHHRTHNTNVDGSSDRKAARLRAAARLASDIAGAATWITNQVDRSAKVACDPDMCRALTHDGFPGQSLDEIGRSVPVPPSAAIVVDTPALRRQLGTSMPADWAPAVLAGFGLGADQVTVRVMAPHGAQAYESALTADQRQRQAVGASLLTSSQITTTRAARSALAAGEVDDRLLLVITALASQHPIDIVAFGRTWPGTSAGVPMRTAFLADSDPAAYLTEPVYVQAMLGLLHGQPPAYRPVNAGILRLAGRKVLSIWFTAPSPIGLIGANP